MVCFAACVWHWAWLFRMSFLPFWYSGIVYSVCWRLGHLNLSIMIPSGISAVVTVICFAKMIDALLENFILCVPCHCRNCSSGNGYDHTIWKFYSIFKCGNRKCDLPGTWVLCSLYWIRLTKMIFWRKRKIPPHQPENAGDAAVFFVCLFEVVITICHGKSSCQLFFTILLS